MRALLLATLAFAACNSAPSQTNQAPFPVAKPTATAPAAPATGAPAVAASPRDSGATPRIARLRTFRDWTVGCDNGGECKAGALGPEAQLPDRLMSITRQGGPTGAVSVAILAQNPLALPLRIAVDGREVASGGRTDGNATRIDGAAATRIAAAVANGRSLIVTDAAQTTGTISLAGASAALHYIDAGQGRVGGVTALVARGPRATAAVPVAPAIPTIVAVTPGGTAATPTVAQIATMRRQAGCERAPEADIAPVTNALGGGKTLVLIPCSVGAYNLSSTPFVIAGNTVAPARIDAPSGFGEVGGITLRSVVNAKFEDGLLSSYAKGRGLGDCGVSQDFVWDGTRFRLAGQRQMSECRGNIDYITVWRATVVRR